MMFMLSPGTCSLNSAFCTTKFQTCRRKSRRVLTSLSGACNNSCLCGSYAVQVLCIRCEGPFALSMFRLTLSQNL